jgi:hypothetical protein
MIDDDRNVLKRIVTGDESWCFMYDPETKRQSETWLSPKEPKAQKLRMQKSRVKIILTNFFLCSGYHSSLICAGKQSVNCKFYKEFTERLIARVHRVRPEF